MRPVETLTPTRENGDVTWARWLKKHNLRCTRSTEKPCTRLGWHFAALQAAWPHLLLLATLCTHQDKDPEARVAKILRLFEEPTIYFARDQDWQPWYRALSPAPGEPPPIDETIGDLAERELTVLSAPN
jgi:hypothetical protein